MSNTELRYQDWASLKVTWVKGLSQDALVAAMDHVETASPELLSTTVAQFAMEQKYSMERLRAECLLWLATRGQEGADWGIPAHWAFTTGLWPPDGF